MMSLFLGGLAFIMLALGVVPDSKIGRRYHYAFIVFLLIGSFVAWLFEMGRL